MGMWNISINGVGAHHNADYANDANKMVAEFVRKLRSVGHIVEHASFTHGARDDVLGVEGHPSVGASGDPKAPSLPQ